jgi:hypothetical protein
MAGREAAEYLTQVHGLPTTEKTLRNQRSQGRGPKCEYYGTLPLYRRTVLDHYAKYEAIQMMSPIARTRRLAREALRIQADQETNQ